MKSAGFLYFVLSVMALRGAAGGEPLPGIPASDRVLAVEEVMNYWTNALERKPVPPKPTGLHPEKQKEWKRSLEARRAKIRALREGKLETAVKLAQLRHNAEAWRRLGNEAEMETVERKLRELTEHLARLETLEIQRRAAKAQIILATLSEACAMTGWKVHSRVLMGNHCLLFIETPEPNLVAEQKCS